MTRLVGLIGYPVEHSLSPAMHNAAFAELGLDYRYLLLPTPLEELEAQVRRCVEQGFVGWNITVPHKQAMLAHLDEMSVEVQATGACNTIRVEDGRLVGFNTDIVGFMAGLEEGGGIAHGSPTVVMGAGGAARAVAYALGSAGHAVTVLSRKPEQAERLVDGLCPCGFQVHSGLLTRDTLAEMLEEANLLVNCTSAGMWPHVESSPLPEGVRLPAKLMVYDLVYKPRPTRLLQQAAEAGCRTQDGLSMLVNQGAAAFEIWTGRRAPVEAMRRARGA